jgi:nicotinate-nucleotide adenylyltransferase
MKTGIMGGTFNPIHQGHIEMMNKAAEEAGLEYIMLIPTGDPPHKVKSEIISKYDRYEMCLLAASELDNVFVSSIEIERPGTTYTIDTLKELEKRYGGMDELYFIIGADTIMNLQSWKNFDQVAKRCSFIAFSRDEFDVKAIETEIEQLAQRYGARINLLKSRVMEVSSSQIREKVQGGESITGMVPKSVELYIKRNKIYRGAEE